MKIRCNQLSMFAFLSFAALTTMSCEKEDGEKLTTSLPDHALTLGTEAGSTATATCTFAKAWQVTTKDKAFEITPVSGEAGTFDLVVKAAETNKGIKEKETQVSISTGNTKADLYIIQKGTPGIEIPTPTYNVPTNAQNLEITLDGNVSFEAATNANWAKIASVEHSEPALLMDGKTHSDSRRSTITVEVGENPESTSRLATVTILSKVGTHKVEIRQAAPLSAEWNRDFYRRTAILRFTATWCYNCPGMATALTKAQEMMPDRIVPISMHAKTSEGGLSYYQADKFEKLYKVTGYPSGIANNMAKISNNRDLDALSKLFQDVVQEATTSYPARTAIHAYSQIAGNKVKVEADIAVKEKNDYKICVFLLENNIIHPQESNMNQYEHNYVVRAILSEDLFGDPLPASESKKIVKYTVEAEIPRSVLNPENLSVVIVVVRPDSSEVQGISNVTYLKLGAIWDNAATLPANGTVDFKYEK